MDASGPLLRTLGRYEIQDEIGRGMMGVVYRAHDPALGRSVALKTVSLAFSIAPDERENFEKRFLAEARVAAGLSHPNIVVVHDVGRDPATGTLYIALEFLKGRTLAEVAAGGAPMDWREALRIAARLGEALHHAHAHGIVHRDVKPANIMVLPSGEPKIMDFGIAKIPASQLTSAGEFFGTPSYMSPEQATGAAVDGRSDLFSLGSVLYLLLTGRRAFDAPSVPAILSRVAQAEVQRPSQLMAEDLPEVDYLLARALAKRPEDRYPDCEAFAEDAEDVLAGRPPRHHPGWKEPPQVEGTLAERPAARPAVAVPLRPDTGGETSFLMRLSDRLGRRGFVVLGALALAGLTVALLLPRGSSGLLPSVVELGHLEIDFEHSLKGGTLRVWVDDELVLEDELESRVTRKVFSYRFRRGNVEKALDVSPGEHVIKVQVTGDGFSGSRRIRGTFEGGVTRRLDARVGGIIKKDLSVEWGL